MDGEDVIALEPPARTRLGRLLQYIEREATFFRVHLAAFTFFRAWQTHVQSRPELTRMLH